MKALVIGFGGMGCRHTQSLISSKQYDKIDVVESVLSVFETNLVRIGSTKEEINYFNDLESVKGNSYDIIVIATSSKPRFEIFSYLTSHVKCINYLIEKVVFQSSLQFEKAIEIVKEKKLKVYCNLPNRYFRNYIELRKQTKGSNSPFAFNVLGGDFGMACNSIHYLDLFYYLSGEYPSYTNSELKIHPNGSKRGNDYVELLGTLSCSMGNGTTFHVSADIRLADIVVVNVKQKDSDRYFFENHKYSIQIKDGRSVSDSFDILPSSILTKDIVADILNDKCLMPTVEEMYPTHKLLFTVYNKAFGIPDSPDSICPIT